MKILLSAFACQPHSGSETGVGWRWAVELAKMHEVVVLTDITRRVHIEKELVTRGVPNLSFEFFRPAWLKWVPLRSGTAQLLYSAWQYSLLPFARRLHREHKFDLVIHLTYGVFRHPSFLGFVGPPFVFGPVGGAEDAPWALKKSLPLRERTKELVRMALNRTARFNPFLRLALSRAAVILARTQDTARALPGGLNGVSAILHHEIGIDPGCINASPSPNPRDLNEPLHALFVGRLLGLKGLHLAIRALALAKAANCRIKLTIVGRGPLEDALKSLAMRSGVGDAISWRGHLPQQEVIKLYREFDCFLFPSLHDSGGTAVLEAMGAGLPIICLDCGGPAALVSPECARVIPTVQSTEDEVAERLAEALMELAADERTRMTMSAAALERVRGMSWECRVRSAMDVVQRELSKLARAAA